MGLTRLAASLARQKGFGAVEGSGIESQCAVRLEERRVDATAIADSQAQGRRMEDRRQGLGARLDAES